MGCLCCSLELLADSNFLERHRREVRRIPGSVTEPIQERHRPLTYLADNASARKPLGEVEDPPPLAQHVGGHPLLDTTFREAGFAPVLLWRMEILRHQ